MLKRVGVVILAVLTLAVPAAAEDWTQTFAIKGTPDVFLKMNDGHIKVVGGNQGEVRATLVATGYERGDYEVRHGGGAPVHVDPGDLRAKGLGDRGEAVAEGAG